MKTLIVYYSFTSNNQILAKVLQEKLEADLYRVETRKKRTSLSNMWDILLNRTPEIKDFYHARNLYDKYIFVAPVWAGRIATPLKAFLQKEKSRIHNYSFITLCCGVPEQKDKLIKNFTEVLGKRPVQVVELSLRDFTFKTRENPSFGKAYKFQLSDLMFFKAKIDDFVNEVRERTLVGA